MNTRLLMSAFAVAGALSCGSPPPPPAAAAPPKPKPAAAAPVAGAGSADGGSRTSEATLAYTYNPIGKRDPFRGLIIGPPQPGGADGGISSGDQCQEPLCQFDLQELALVAVVSGDANPMAMVEDPGHTGYLVRRNTKIGKNGGKVTSILPNCLQVTNYVTSAEGKSLPNRVDLCVKVDEKMRDPQDLFKNKVN